MKRQVSLVVALVLIVLPTAWFDYDTWREYYSSGPPYYGRTVNMDKWQDPLPELIGVNLVIGIAATLLIRALLRASRKR